MVKQAGYIKIDRAILSHPVVGAGQPAKPAKKATPTYSKLEAWMDLIILAKYTPEKAMNRGRVVKLDRGQMICARTYLAKRWNWTEKAVRCFLDALFEWEMISNNWKPKGQQKGQQKTNLSQVLTICNYDTYQDQPKGANEQEGPAKGPARGQQKGQQKGQVGGQQKGQQSDGVSDCNNLENDDCTTTQGPAKGPAGGPAEGPAKGPEKVINTNTSKVEAPNNGAPPEPPENGGDKSRGKRLPGDWEPGQNLKDWAAKKTSLDASTLASESEKFIDYWQAAAGQSARKRDWDAAWRVWIRRANDGAVRQQKITEHHDRRYAERWGGAEQEPDAQAAGWREKPEIYLNLPHDRWIAAINAEELNGRWPEDKFGPYIDKPGCVMPESVKTWCAEAFGTKYLEEGNA